MISKCCKESDMIHGADDRTTQITTMISTCCEESHMNRILMVLMAQVALRAENENIT